MTTGGGFGLLDLIVVIVYLVGTTLLGVWLGRDQKNAKDYFVAGSEIPWWAIMFSVVATVTAVAILPATVQPVAGQAAVAGQFAPYTAPRSADGKADLNGIWQAFVTANIDLLDHDAQSGPHPETMGVYGAWPAGQSIVEGGEIPYRPEALAKRRYVSPLYFALVYAGLYDSV